MSVQNPQDASKDGLTSRTMYEYDNHQNIPWNMLEYQPVREYADPMKQIQQRKYGEQKKGQPDTRYKTKRGFYMDYHIKVVKMLPAPSNYKFRDQWTLTDAQKKMNSQRKVDSSLSKYTYLDRIIKEEKIHPRAPVGAYNLNKTDSDIKEEIAKLKTKKINNGQKRFFYEDTEHLSNLAPGMGSHNPHDDDILHLRLNKTDYKFWTKKHLKEAESIGKKRLSETSPCHYTPIPLQYGTFDRIKTSHLLRVSKKKESSTGFGTDAKFTYDRPNKKKIMEKRPDPGDHNVFIPWKGKNDDSKTKGWLRSRSTGFSESLYH